VGNGDLANQSGTEELASSDYPTLSRAASSIKEHYDSMKGLICGFLAASSAGINLDLIKVLLFYTQISEFELIYQRSFIACIIVIIILYWGGHSPFDIDRQVALYASLRVLGSCFGFMLMIFSLDFIPVSKSVLIVNNPLLTSIISFLLIGERSSRHDIICFLICTVGVVLLTDPMKENGVKLDIKNLIGVSLSFLASLSFNVSYVALRKLKNKQVNSWILVFHIMTANLLFMPSCFLGYDMAYRHQLTQYTSTVWLLLLLIGLLTVSTLFFTHLTFYYESAARGAAYTNFELLYTYIFDVLVMKNDFRLMEIVGAGLILMGNFYLYLLKTYKVIS
jgi:drug/metabolite transporter (DMT)-like permease